VFSSALHVGRPNIHDQEEFLRHARLILESRWLTNDGQYVRDLEAALAERLMVRHVVATCNATIGLQIALKALMGEEKGEVIVPAFTFVATAQAVSWLGLAPVFADVLSDTHCLDPEDVERRISPRTRAILGVHLWGGACDVDRLSAIAKRHGLKLIYDAAHAFGSRLGPTPIANFGDAEVFSFHATKVFNTFEGGAIATNDDDLASRLRLIRNFGFSGYDAVDCLGVNGKMSEICAAMGIVNLKGVDGFIAANRNHYETYRTHLLGLPGLAFHVFAEGLTSNCQYIVLEVDETKAGLSRNALVSFLQSEGVLARRYFAPGVNHMAPYGAADGPPDPSLPVSERLSHTVAVLPTGPSLTEEDVRKVCGLIRAAVNRAAA
jgi:dTDP-4-amino-4,6-dideoxygalactose transaminase